MDSRVRPEFAERVLPIDDAVATRCARLHVPDHRNEAHALIAATALVHGLAVVTRNVQDFDGAGATSSNRGAVEPGEACFGAIHCTFRAVAGHCQGCRFNPFKSCIISVVKS